MTAPERREGISLPLRRIVSPIEVGRLSWNVRTALAVLIETAIMVAVPAAD